MSNFERINVSLVGAEIKFCAQLFDNLAAQIYRDDDCNGDSRRRVLADQLRDAANERCRALVIDLAPNDLIEIVNAFCCLADYLAEEGPTAELKKLAGLLAHREPGDLRARADRLEALLKKSEVP